jgi:cobalt-zinc-cadmium efflux system membrane fusion protein
VSGEILVAETSVSLVVKRSALQSVRGRTVVFEQEGDRYEARPLVLGRRDNEHVEVLGGLDAGARYVTTNSYLVKADIEKSGAAHEH